MRYTEQIPVERNRLDNFMQAIEVLRNKMETGENAFVFPELTRCDPGLQGTQNFSTAPFKAARDADAVVIPIALKNTDRVWPKGSMQLRFGEKVDFRMLEPIPARAFATAEELTQYVKQRIDGAIA